jgi:hypothetical protein
MIYVLSVRYLCDHDELYHVHTHYNAYHLGEAAQFISESFLPYWAKVRSL